MTSDRRRRAAALLVAWCALWCDRRPGAWAAEPAVAEPVVIEMGDARRTVVTITDDGRDYALAVRMLAVKSFDEPSDREANRGLSRAAALSALTRHLKVGQRQELVVREFRAGAETTEEGTFRLSFAVPKSGVKVVERPAPDAGKKIDPEFAPYLLADPLLMELEGAKVIRLDDGRVLVLGVASSALKDASAADRKRAETIARQRALAHIVAEKTGVQVARAETIDRKTTVTIDADAGERAESVAEYLETTQARVKGGTRDFPIVGRWTSDDGTLFTVAVGGFFKLPADAKAE